MAEVTPREAVELAKQVLRRRLVDFHASPVLLPYLEENQRKLCALLEETIEQGCSNSALLLGPRGCGKSMVVEDVLRELNTKFEGRFFVVRLNGLTRPDDRSAVKEIAKQLCVVHDLPFSKGATFEENWTFIGDAVQCLSSSQRAIVFILDEFDLFAQRSKQSLLYNLLNIQQSPAAQVAMIGISCRLDADQLLEKRVRSRFSQRKFLFLPPSAEEMSRLLELLFLLPVDPSAPYSKYARAFNAKTSALLAQESTKQLLKQLTNAELSPRYVADMIFRSVCAFSQRSVNMKPTIVSQERRPTIDSIAGLSVLELLLLTSMKRLEARDFESYTFAAVYKEYMQLPSSHQTADTFAKHTVLQAFEHLLERELVGYPDGKVHRSMSQARPVKMLISPAELWEGLQASPVCPATLKRWFSHEVVA